MEQVGKFLSLDIMSRQKYGGKSEIIRSASLCLHCDTNVASCTECSAEKRKNYVKKDTVFLLEYERQGKGKTGNYGNDFGCFQHGDDNRFFGKKPRYIKA